MQVKLLAGIALAAGVLVALVLHARSAASVAAASTAEHGAPHASPAEGAVRRTLRVPPLRPERSEVSLRRVPPDLVASPGSAMVRETYESLVRQYDTLVATCKLTPEQVDSLNQILADVQDTWASLDADKDRRRHAPDAREAAEISDARGRLKADVFVDLQTSTDERIEALLTEEQRDLADQHGVSLSFSVMDLRRVGGVVERSP